MFLRARAADSHCEIIRFPVWICSSSALCPKMNSQSLQGFLARELSTDRPPNEGWPLGFGEACRNRSIWCIRTRSGRRLKTRSAAGSLAPWERRNEKARVDAGVVVASAWSLTARAQQTAKLPTIGFMGAGSPSSWSQWTAASGSMRELYRTLPYVLVYAEHAR